jgi:hypothetical protein
MFHAEQNIGNRSNFCTRHYHSMYTLIDLDWKGVKYLDPDLVCNIDQPNFTNFFSWNDELK